MKILLIAATNTEIDPLVKQLIENKCSIESDKKIIYHALNIDILITGIGLVFTAYHLAKTLIGQKYDLVLNMGIAGSFNKDIRIGEVVIVKQEEFCDLGIEGVNEYKTIFESGFIDKQTFPFRDGKLKADRYDNEIIKHCKQVRSISSNTAHGKGKTINALIEKFNPDIESMEGAAFFYVCLMESVNFIQIRAISNYVETRNVKNWNIPLALENLAIFVIRLLDDLSSARNAY
jgi:futalosine hydrolase